jgi:predicted HTH transcriptional regulator
MLVKLSEMELKALIQGGETNTVELKVAAPRATEMAERLCGMANAQGGVVIIGVKDSFHEIVGVLPGITVEQMERGEVQSKLRNPALANLLIERGRLKGTGQRAARRYVLA